MWFVSKNVRRKSKGNPFKSRGGTKSSNKYDEHELIKIVNACRQTKFQSPNTDHLSPVGEHILTAGMMEEYSIVLKRIIIAQAIIKFSIVCQSVKTGTYSLFF